MATTILMAAAPDLLEALYSAKAELLTAQCLVPSKVEKNEIQLTLNKINNAIQKAITN
jgi:NAD dependent epimerase/dehydratase family enzyme